LALPVRASARLRRISGCLRLHVHIIVATRLVMSIQPDGVGTANAVMLLIGQIFLSLVIVRLNKQ
jgi:hypothetical protein